jgi:hypothetical protein
MANWAEFAAAAPEIAAEGRRLFYRTETGEALLATIRGTGLPQVHPIYLAIVGDRLVAFMNPSAKATDLAEDGRYALHAHQDPAEPHEFLVRGRATEIVGALRDEIAAAWYFTASEGYRLFEFDIERVVFGRRATADDWPPVYTAWRSPAA